MQLLAAILVFFLLVPDSDALQVLYKEVSIFLTSLEIIFHLKKLSINICIDF